MVSNNTSVTDGQTAERQTTTMPMTHHIQSHNTQF